MIRLRGLCGTGAVLLCLGISGCDDSSSSPTETPTSAPTAPPPMVVLEANFTLDVNFVTFGPFDISSTGTIDALVNYMFADSLVAVWLARGQCSFDMFMADQCNYVATSFDDPPSTSPSGSTWVSATRVSATNQPAGTYTLIISNGGPQSETFAVQVVFTDQAGVASRPGGSDLSSSDTRRWTAPARRF